MSNLVKFSYGLLANYNGLATKDQNTVYFITDHNYIYFKGVKYGVENGDIAAISGVALGDDNKTLTFSFLDGSESKAIVLAEATQAKAGLMSAADKAKLDAMKDNSELVADLTALEEATAAAQKTADDHIADADVHITAEERTKLGNIDASLVGVAASKLPVSEATQAELDKKVDAEDGKSLVSDELITKLAGLNDQATTNQTITDLTGRVAANEGSISTINGNITTINGEIDAVEKSLNDFIATKGSANGIASLDENGLVPASQLPSYVDDVVEADSFDALPSEGEASKIYVTLDNNKTYRWGGSAYVEISSALALGETTGTAYEGSKGKANADAIAAHVADKENPHGVTAAQLNIDSSFVNTTAANLPISTATQTALDGKVDKVEGKSLVADAQITKLEGLKSQADLTSEINTAASNAQSAAEATASADATSKADAAQAAAIAAAKTETESQVGAEATARKAADKNITGFEETYAANASANYISDATSLNDADVKLDAKLKEVIDDLASLTGTGEGTIAEQIDSKVDAAKQELNGTISAMDTAYKAADATLTQGVADNKAAIEEVEGNLSDLDTAVADFKNKNVGTAITAPGSDEVLPTTKAVVDYVKAATDGVANSMTYAAKDGDATKMELKLIAVDGTTLSTIEMDKENFLSNFVKREATAEDAAADASITAGDPILVVTLVNGDVFRVNLKSLVDVYTGVANQAITTSVDGYVVKATLNIDSAANTASAVKLSVGDNGLSAAVAIDSTKNGANGITLAADGNGISAALKIDEASNTANGTVMTVGANGVSVGIVWTEL